MTNPTTQPYVGSGAVVQHKAAEGDVVVFAFKGARVRLDRILKGAVVVRPGPIHKRLPKRLNAATKGEGGGEKRTGERRLGLHQNSEGNQRRYPTLSPQTPLPPQTSQPQMSQANKANLGLAVEGSSSRVVGVAREHAGTGADHAPQPLRLLEKDLERLTQKRSNQARR